MKCRVCGREIDPQKGYCDKCGARIVDQIRTEDGEFSWNTIDFPKPKEVTDIEMNWGQKQPQSQERYMTVDASEGFVTHAKNTELDPPQVMHQMQSPFVQPQVQPVQQAPVRPVQQMQQPVQQPIEYSIPQQMTWTMPASTWNMPSQQQVVIPQPYNVQATPINTASPTISAMPQMPQGYVQPVQQAAPVQQTPLQFTQPMQPVQQTPLQFTQPMQPVQQTPLQFTQPMQPVQQTPLQFTQPMQPVQQTPLQFTQPMQPVQQAAPVQQTQAAPVQQRFEPAHFINPEIQPAQFTRQTVQSTRPDMPVAPAAVKNPMNVDAWLDEQLKDSDVKTDDKFFTFYKKNEDFQKLLDEEYARYKSKYDTNAESLKSSQVLSAAAISAAAAAGAAEAQKRAAAKNIQQQAPASTIPQQAPATKSTMVYRSTKPNGGIPVNNAGFSQPSENLFNGEPITDFDRMIFEGTKDAQSLGDSTLAISNEDLRKEIDEVAQQVEEAYGQPSQGYERISHRQNLANMAQARSAFFAEPDEKEDLDKTSAQEMKSIFDQWDKERREAEEAEKAEKKKGGFGRFLLVLLIILIILAAADYAFTRVVEFGPVTQFFTQVNEKISDTVGGFGKKEEAPAAPAESARELTAQEKAAQAVNKNIKEMSFDVDSAKYNSQGTYGFPNIGAMTVVEDEDTVVGVTKAIVGYNSTWIDYVNGGGADISCFDYLKADGSAFRSASSFDTKDKTETFKKLNIGEIRKDANNVYAFVDENILVKIGSSTTEVASRVIYKLALVGDAYKIVEYDNYS